MRIPKRFLTLIAIFILAGCGQSSKPSNDAIKAQVAKGLPAFLNVEEIKLDPQNDGQNGWQIKWDATVAPKETLFIKGTSITPPPKNDGTTPESKTLIKVAQKPDQTFHLYGTLTANKVGENWNFASQPTSGLSQFGRPRGDFDSKFIVEGSPEHQEIQKAFQDMNDADEKKKAMLAELTKKDEDVKNQKYAKAKEAFPEGLVLKGNLSQERFLSGDTPVAMDVTMTIQGVAGDTWIVVIADPTRPAVKQTFEGKFAPLKGDEAAGDLPNLQLQSLANQNLSGDIPKFFTEKRELILTPKVTGIDGFSKDTYKPFTLTFRK